MFTCTRMHYGCMWVSLVYAVCVHLGKRSSDLEGKKKIVESRIQKLGNLVF